MTMLKVFLRTGRSTIQRVLTTHSPTSPCLPRITRRYAESSAITKTESSLPADAGNAGDESNRRKYNKTAVLDLCRNKFDHDLLYFPEVLTKEEWTELVNHGQVVEETMNLVKYNEVLKTDKVDDGTRERLARWNVWKMRIPEMYGGLDYKETQAQYIHEILAIRPSIARMVAEQEEMCVKVLVKYGTEAQKQKYLPKLATGEIKMAFAFLEGSSSTLDPNSFLGLEVIQENDKFILKGEKNWVFNAKSADAFIVIGTQSVSDDEGCLKITSLFVIDKDKENVIVFKPMEKKWFRGVEICTVSFDEVTVGPECLLGQYGKGFEMFVDIFKKNKTSVLAECSSIMKRLVFDASDKCDHLKVYSVGLNFDYGDYGIGELSLYAYVTESLTYYLAGRADYYENPDLSIEMALAKIFATEALPEALHTYFSFVGRFSYDKNSVLEELVQNSPYYSMLDDSIFDMKIFIMSQAIKYLSIEHGPTIKMLKDPLNHPVPAIKHFLKSSDVESDKTVKLDLRDSVHLDLGRAADELEYCVSQFAHCSEKHILKRMKHSMEHDYDLVKLCEIWANTYALIACIARASRAATLRTKDWDKDIMLAYAFATKTGSKVKNLASLLCRNEEELECCAEIGRKAFTNKNYISEHPLTRVF